MQLLIKLMFSTVMHRWPQSILAILFRPFRFIAPETLNYLTFKYVDFECTRNASCALNLISTFVLHKWRSNGIDLLKPYYFAIYYQGSLKVERVERQIIFETMETIKKSGGVKLFFCELKPPVLVFNYHYII